MDQKISVTRKGSLVEIEISGEDGEVCQLSMSADAASHFGAALLSAGEEKSQASQSLFERTPFMAMSNPLIEVMGSDNGNLHVALATGIARPLLVQLDKEHCDYWLERLRDYMKRS